MIEYEAHNKYELRTYLRLLATEPEALLCIVGKQSWRFQFYKEYDYFPHRRADPTQKMMDYQITWPLFQEDVISFLLANPHYTVEVKP